MINNRNKNLFWQGLGNTQINIPSGYLAFPNIQPGSGAFVTSNPGNNQFTLAVGTYRLFYNTSWIQKITSGDSMLSVAFKNITTGAQLGAMASISPLDNVINPLGFDGGTGVVEHFLVVISPITIGLAVLNGTNVRINDPSNTRVISLSIQKIA